VTHSPDIHSYTHTRTHSQRGFTLLELAVALFVVSVLLTGLISSIAIQVERRRVTDTRQQLEEAREALIGFALINKRLPGPADANGIERTNCVNEVDCTGLIPWATLGVRRLDAFDKVIRYSVTPALTSTTSLISLTSVGTKDIFRSSNPPTTTADVAQNAMAVIWSHGARNFGTTEDNTAIANATTGNLDEIANVTGTFSFGGAGSQYVSRPPSGSDYIDPVSGVATGEFDDLLVWLPTATVIARLSQAGRLP
jgi:prepilin-type N-terminal cleavage/methylation domain-containing protein